MVIEKVLGFVFGKHAESWKIMKDSWDKASKTAKPGTRLTEKNLNKFLTTRDWNRFEKARKQFDAHFRRERAKTRLRKVI